MEIASPFLEIAGAISFVYIIAYAWANRPMRDGERCHVCGKSHWR